MSQNNEQAQPTPGPWVVNFDENTREYFVGQQALGGVVVGTGQPIMYSPRHDRSIAEANVRLIAAACNSYQRHCADPVAAAEGDLLGELLEALEDINDTGFSGGPQGKRARTAIAKAAGGQSVAPGMTALEVEATNILETCLDSLGDEYQLPADIKRHMRQVISKTQAKRSQT